MSGHRTSEQNLRLFGAAVVVLVAAALVAACAWVNYEALTEAYGSGPPYYGRTTNMDKWSDPIPSLAVMDAVVLLIMIGLVALFVGLVAARDSARRGS